MTTVADVVDAVAAVDTHADTLAVAVAAASGALLAQGEFPATAAGQQELIGWVLQLAPAPALVFAVEGTRSYGIGLTRALRGYELPVLELERPSRAARRCRGKSDPIDAVLGARTALALDADALPTPRADGDREALRILLTAREEMVTEKTAKTNRLIAVLRGGSDADRELVRGKLTADTLTRITRRRGHRGESREEAVRRAEAHRLAVAIRELQRALTENNRQVGELVDALAPGLTSCRGVGPISAGHAIVAFSHPGRIHSEAGYAMLAGAAPIPASSGRTVRHRLNRGGDRRLNAALHTIAVTRMRDCPTTRGYVQRRRAQGLTDREIRRCLKRYIARQLYRRLTAVMTPPAA